MQGTPGEVGGTMGAASLGAGTSFGGGHGPAVGAVGLPGSGKASFAGKGTGGKMGNAAVTAATAAAIEGLQADVAKNAITAVLGSNPFTFAFNTGKAINAANQLAGFNTTGVNLIGDIGLGEPGGPEHFARRDLSASALYNDEALRWYQSHGIPHRRLGGPGSPVVSLAPNVSYETHGSGGGGGGEAMGNGQVGVFSRNTALEKILGEQAAKKLQSEMAGPPAAYPGQMHVPITPQEQKYLDFVNSLGEQKAIQELTSGEIPYETGPEFADRYFEESIRPGYISEFEDVTLPQLRESYAGPGYWGSARARAETKAGADLAEELARARGELRYKETLGARDAKEAALNRASSFYPELIRTYGDAGALTRSVEESKVLSNLQRWLMGEEVGGKSVYAYHPGWQLALSLLGISDRDPIVDPNYGVEEPEWYEGLLTGAAGSAGKALGSLAVDWLSDLF